MPACGLDAPPAVDEPAADDLVTEADAVGDVVFVCDSLAVGLDLFARRVPVAPVGRGRERIGIEMGRDVAGEPRIGVLPPRTADPIGLLVDGEVGEPGL